MVDANIKSLDEDELKKYVSDNEETLVEIAKEIVARRLSVRIHISLYVIANSITTLIYFLTNNENSYWLLWVLIPWLVAIIVHVGNYYIYRNGSLSTINAYIYFYHLMVFLPSMLMIFFIDGFTSDPYWEIDWAYWVLFGWGLAMIIHTIIYLVLKKTYYQKLN